MRIDDSNLSLANFLEDIVVKLRQDKVSEGLKSKLLKLYIEIELDKFHKEQSVDVLKKVQEFSDEEILKFVIAGWSVYNSLE